MKLLEIRRARHPSCGSGRAGADAEASEKAGGITGQAINVDGGAVMV